MMSFVGGIIALVVGLIGIICWWGEFLDLIMGALPIMFILGGALAAYLGIEELKDKKVSENADNSDTNLKGEVENLKEELKELKEEKDTLETEEKE